MPPGEIYRRLLGYCAPYWGIFLLAALAMAVLAAVDTSFAAVIGQVVETLSPDSAGEAPGFWRRLWPDVSWERWFPLVIFALFLLRGLAGYGAAYGLGWIGRQVIKTLRGEVFGKFLRLPNQYFDARSTGDLLTKLAYNIEQIAEATSTAVTIIIRDTLTLVGLLAYMIYLSPPLSLFVFVVAPVIALMIRVLGRLFRRHSARIQDSMGDVLRITGEMVQSHRIVKIFGGQAYEEDRFEQANEKNRRLNMRLMATRAAGEAVTGLVLACGVAGVVFFASLDSVRQGDVGDLVGFLTAMVLAMRPLRQLTNVNVALQRGIAAGGSIFQVLDTPEERDTGTHAPRRVRGDVSFRHVSFSYGGGKAAALCDVDLHVAAGETLAIVGRSGSGKSTLVNLLPRFYEPDAGRILLDGRPLADYTLGALRAQISLVSQEVVLFNDSIANNIAYGALTAVDRAAIEAAAEAAHVDEFAREQPGGLDATVGDRGVLLSGGQRQRIAIARALLKDAPVLILDEATSALDTQSERHIQDALARLMEDRTTFVIAHRLSTVENADRIIVMAEGRIVETGTHAELLALEGHYASLYRLQFRDEAA